MGRAARGLVLVVAWALVVACTKTPTDSVTKDVPSSAKPAAKSAPAAIPQAAPMIAVLRAAKSGDAQALRAAYSRRIQDAEKAAAWDDHVRQAKEKLKDKYGDYEIAEFTFSFQGGADRGELTMNHASSEPLALDVVKEDDGWKLDER